MLTSYSGLASGLSLWVVPLILQAPPETATSQFCSSFSWGKKYLQPTSRALSLALVSITWLVSRHTNPYESRKWAYWAASVAILVPVGPYEVNVIFPINDRIFELQEIAEKDRTLDVAKTRELETLLKKWKLRHWMRVLLPLAAALVAIPGVISH